MAISIGEKVGIDILKFLFLLKNLFNIVSNRDQLAVKENTN
jgi:hypothetical protein